MLNSDRIIEILYMLPGLLIALSIHEFSHGSMAYRLGDNTARDLGRLTMNPIKHIDLFGLLALILVRFGWAKPVPVNTRNFKKPRRDIALVSLAGPVANLLMAFLGVFLFAVFGKIVEWNAIAILQSSLWSRILPGLSLMLQYFTLLNLGLGLFNLIPLPPLDGSKILYSLLPGKASLMLMRNERYLSMLLFLLLITGWVVQPVMSYLIGLVLSGMATVVSYLPFL